MPRLNKSHFNYKHWLVWTKIYWIFNWIQNRCTNPKLREYKNYWGRWIKCEWKDVADFYKDMWSSYKIWLSIDRINNNWNYCKSNCRWATKKVQANNTTRNIYLLFNWEKHTLSEWADIRSLNYYTLYSRIKRWWSIDKALLT